MSTEKEDDKLPSCTKKVDIFRDTPVRYLGYANEIGEAFRALVSTGVVKLSYVVASAYVCADTVDKAGKKVNEERSKNDSDLSIMKPVAFAAIDTLLWQSLASVIIPGFTINRICAMTFPLLTKVAPSLAQSTRNWITTGVGLSTIPFIVHPIDSLVHFVMDHSTRKAMGLNENVDDSNHSS